MTIVDTRAQAMAHMRRVMLLIVIGAVLLSVAVLGYFAWVGPIQPHMVVAVLGGIFFATLIGCGLFALAFFSDQSGHDREVDDATKNERK
jgi:ABC-type Fe3+-siderophore transport system permease subunit